MVDVDVLIPMLGRAERVPEIIENLAASQRLLELRPLFIVTESDGPVLEALSHTPDDVLVLPEPWEPGDYARKMNAGIRNTMAPWIFFASSDLDFHHGWADCAVGVACCEGRRVVGTNDLGNRQVAAGRHSTHSLFHRSYAQLGSIDDPDVVLHEGYSHNWVDNEFIETAKARGEFVHEPESVVEHLHPLWGKGEMDDTYRTALVAFEDDRRLYNTRQRLWHTDRQRGTPKRPR